MLNDNPVKSFEASEPLDSANLSSLMKYKDFKTTSLDLSVYDDVDPRISIQALIIILKMC